MGYYINPPGMSKETWLSQHGKLKPLSECKVTETEVPVCLVDNGVFTAAGIAFNDKELEAFSQPDSRYRQWYMVPLTELYKVSDLPRRESREYIDPENGTRRTK